MRALVLGGLLLALMACGGGEPGTDDAGYDPAAHADAALDGGAASPWRSEPPLPAAVQEIAVAAHAGRIWVAGGFEEGAVVATVRVYDPASGAWSEGPELPAPRHHMALVSFGEDLYALGGMQTLAFEPLDTAWALRGGASVWEEVAPLPGDRGAHAAARVGALVVVVGGNASAGRLADETLIYEPATDAWRTGRAIPSPREHLAAVEVDGELWALAGRRNSLRSNTDVVEIYDPASDTWRAGPAMPTARGGFAAAVLDGAIYAVGGEQPDRALDSVDRYDLESAAWSAAPPVPTPRHGHGVAALAGRLFVVGGGDRPLFAAVAVVESYAP